MIIFNTDLDNTMIFSYKHNIGDIKRNVEIYENREISFITQKTYELLQKVIKETVFVPTTTRTIEQYKRIDLGIGVPKYALVCNGGVLLIDGEVDKKWYNNSLQLVKNAVGEMEKAMDVLNVDERRIMEVRYIEKLFVFTKCNDPEKVVSELRFILDESIVDVFNNGLKIYIVPKKLSKGHAVVRFREYLNGRFIIAAGDSEFDISMFKEANVAIAPKSLSNICLLPKTTHLMPQSLTFSEEVLFYVLKVCLQQKKKN